MADTTLAANVRAVAEQWPGISRVEGQSRNRPIAGTSTTSEHVYGNALDIYGSRDAMATLAAHLNANKGQLAIRIVCYDGGPGPSYDRCTTKHIDHIHTDMVPSCAGIVSPSGDATTRHAECEKYQQGGRVTSGEIDWESVAANDAARGGASGTGDGFLGIPGALDRFSGSVEGFFRTGILVVIGAGIVAAGVVLAVKDTDAFKAIKGAAKTAVTKGAM